MSAEFHAFSLVQKLAARRRAIKHAVEVQDDVEHERGSALLEIDRQLRAGASIDAGVSRFSWGFLEVHGEGATVGSELQRTDRERVGTRVHQGREPEPVVLFLDTVHVERRVPVRTQGHVVLKDVYRVRRDAPLQWVVEVGVFLLALLGEGEIHRTQPGETAIDRQTVLPRASVAFNEYRP